LCTVKKTPKGKEVSLNERYIPQQLGEFTDGGDPFIMESCKWLLLRPDDWDPFGAVIHRKVCFGESLSLNAELTKSLHCNKLFAAPYVISYAPLFPALSVILKLLSSCKIRSFESGFCGL
jgi:hypothetical protein